GADAVHDYALGREAAGEVLADAHQRRLGRGVADEARVLMARRGGPEGHDAGEARLAEERQRGAHAAHGAEHALVEGVQPVRVGELLERAGARRPGRAHERVERAPAAADGREGGLHVRRDEQVRPQRQAIGRPPRTRSTSAVASPGRRGMGSPIRTRTRTPHGMGNMLFARSRQDWSIVIGTTGTSGAASSSARVPARRNSRSSPARERVPSGKITAETPPACTRRPSSRIVATAPGASPPSTSTSPPARGLNEAHVIQRPSDRLEMYLGKLRKRSVPRSAMSNMLWWLETTTYDRPGTNPGARSTARRVPH